MSEPKEHLFVPCSELQEGDELTDAFTIAKSYYLKSEADKVIAHNKYKRCLAMAKRCEAEAHKCLTQQCALVSFQETDRFQYLQRNFMHFSRWHKRWLELAEQFKEAK